MRINVYSQELTPEVRVDAKRSNTGLVYRAVRLMLHSSPMLHHPPADDDRSAITFWLPSSKERCDQMAEAFDEIARRFREGPATLVAKQAITAPKPCDGLPGICTDYPDCPCGRAYRAASREGGPSNG